MRPKWRKTTFGEYSVWDPHTRMYSYYQAPSELDGGVFAPKPKLPYGHRLGITPEEAAYPLPAGAVLIGRGNEPRGLIARSGPLPVGFFGLDPHTTKWLVLLGGGFLAWKYFFDEPGKAKAKRFLMGK